MGALKRLMAIRKKVWGKDEVPLDEFRGVVKLGFSWGGFDVLPFQGPGALISRCRKLFDQPKVENIVCVVQEMIPNIVGEHRVLCIYDKCRRIWRKESLWMQSMKPTQNRLGTDISSVPDFKLATSITVESGQVPIKFFGGDRMAYQAAERQASNIVDKWLTWYQTETAEPPPCTRIDFLVSYQPRGRVQVWTCEVGECGASLCGVEVHGRNLAALNNAILKDDARRFPRSLPDHIPRNSGWKS